MVGLLTLGLIVAMVLLWKRVSLLERRIEALTASPVSREETQAEFRFEPGPVSAGASVPPVRKPATVVAPQRRHVDAAAASTPAPDQEEGQAASPEPVAQAPRRERPALNFEELFGSRLPIWAGGITLAVAGLFIVKYSIDTGLLSPLVRVLLGLLFALALVAGAEAARRWKATAIDPRVAQALGGAGVAAAYADILVATNVYHLVPQWLGFGGLALTTLAALGLALRFGAPSALLALVGGLAAPALAGERGASLAPLVLYLALVVAGLAAVARRQRWPWLTAAALVGGFGWGVVLMALMRLDSGDGLVLGGYVLLLGLAIPLLASRQAHEEKLRAASALIAMIQIAMIVSTGGHALLNWGLYGLLALAVQWLALREPRLGWLPLAALVIGLLTMLGWPQARMPDIAYVSAGMILLFAPLALRRFADRRDAIMATLALGGTLAVAAMAAPSMLTMIQWGWAAILLSVPLFWRAQDRTGLFFIPATAAAAMLAIGVALLFLPVWRPIALAALSVIAVEAWRRRPDLDGRVPVAVLMAGLLVVQARWLGDWAGAVLQTLAGRPLLVGDIAGAVDALRLFVVPAMLLGLGWWRAGVRLPRRAVLLPLLTGGIGLFMLYKQFFGIAGPSDFTARGLAERALLDAALFGCAWVAAERGRMRLALALFLAALARVLLYDVLLFNPLWRDQLVGPLPVANLLAPVFLLPVVALWLAERYLPQQLRLPGALLQIILFLFYAAGAVRQLFHGSLIAVGGVSAAESFAYSATAILLALAFLGWGIVSGHRIWRLASLALMLVAIGKVFLVDAAGLDGLLRIASFVGLGLSLIGIGWLYSRHLGGDQLRRG